MNIEQAYELRDYLRAGGHIDAHETPQQRRLSGGVSNRTVWLQRASGEAWVIKQALSKLRVEVDWFSSPQRAQREALGLECLYRLLPQGCVPELLFADAQQHLLAMRAVPEPHVNWKEDLLRGTIDSAIVAQFGRLLGRLHQRSSVRLEEWPQAFNDRRFFQSLRLEPYYGYAAEQVAPARGFLQALIDDTLAQQLCLVHGDYSPKNTLLYRGQLVLLDYEVIHIGDPGFDVGFALTHLLSKAHHLSQQRAAFGAAAMDFWQSYWQALGHSSWRTALPPRAVRHTLACLLARVAGRSPLEYLTAAERARQQTLVLMLMRQPPATLQQLIEAFIDGLSGDK